MRKALDIFLITLGASIAAIVFTLGLFLSIFLWGSLADARVLGVHEVWTKGLGILHYLLYFVLVCICLVVILMAIKHIWGNKHGSQ